MVVVVVVLYSLANSSWIKIDEQCKDRLIVEIVNSNLNTFSH